MHLDGVEEKKREKQQKKRNSRSGVQDDEEAMKCAGAQCRRRAGIPKENEVPEMWLEEDEGWRVGGEAPHTPPFFFFLGVAGE